MSVYAFGPFEKPHYVAELGRAIFLATAKKWCCTKGHKTPRLAALHGARIASDQWLQDTPEAVDP